MRKLVFTESSQTTTQIYAILDGAACEELLQKIDELSPPHYCLFAGELEPDVEEVAPYLILLEEEHDFTRWLFESIGKNPWGIFIKASATLREMRKHFRQFLMVKGPDGKQLYMRFYDPRVLPMFLRSSPSAQVTQFFGPVTEFVCRLEAGGVSGFRHRKGELIEGVPHSFD